MVRPLSQADLLPRGADVYALGVQECQCWSELRQAVLLHLGNDFVALGTAQLGAAFLKGTIGIALFATREALLKNPHLPDVELKGLMTAEWPRERKEIGAYSRGLPEEGDDEAWKKVLQTMRRISSRLTQREC